MTLQIISKLVQNNYKILQAFCDVIQKKWIVKISGKIFQPITILQIYCKCFILSFTISGAIATILSKLRVVWGGIK